VLSTIALISITVVLALWFKRTGERHDRAFAEQQVRLGIYRSPASQRHKIEAVEGDTAPRQAAGRPGGVLTASRSS
jgi:hypothetical protein